MNYIPTKNVRKIFRAFLYIFACIGFVFVLVFFGMRWGLFNVKGSISERNSYFNIMKKSETPDAIVVGDLTVSCQINVLGQYAPLTAINIYKTLSKGTDKYVLAQMISVASERFITDPNFRRDMNQCNNGTNNSVNLPMSAFYWADTDQWNLMKEVFTRDQDIIKKAGADAGIAPRLILSAIIGEQFRFFNSRREVFKSYFEPLKILASLSNTSYGIAGLKPKTVGLIEDHLKDPQSPFYLGPEMEHIVDYDTTFSDRDSQQLSRITDPKNPYYSYLYVGLFMRQIQEQWKKKGYDLSNRPEILATIYNLGFYYSVPKENPQAGGTTININNVDYTFGDIAYEFYYSGELGDIFPLAQ
jgi:hypothetical protein